MIRRWLFDRIVPASCFRWSELDSAAFDADRIRRLRGDPWEPLPLPETLRALVDGTIAARRLEDRP